MHDGMVSNLALTRALPLVLQRQRGDVLRVAVSYRCENPVCPVTVVKIGVVEAPGKKSMQPPSQCCRCSDNMAYIGMEMSR